MIIILVGVERFELPTSWSQTRRATRLRYTPRVSNSTLEDVSGQCNPHLFMSKGVFDNTGSHGASVAFVAEASLGIRYERPLRIKRAPVAPFLFVCVASVLSGLRLLLGGILVLDRLHRQAHATLFIGLQHLDLD